MAKRIVALMPPHKHFCEVYAGGLSVLLAKNPEGVSEVCNDIDGRLVTFWTTLMDPGSFELFRVFMEVTPFSERVWEIARETLEQPCERPGSICLRCAAAFFVCCRQSLAGRMHSFAPLSARRTRRGMNEQVSAWLTAVEGLPEVHARLMRVVALNRPALDVISTQDGPGTLFYLDPPYLADTRTAPEVYQHEMTAGEHLDLLCELSKIEGKFLLSGYRSELYAHHEQLNGWHRVDFDLANHAAGGSKKRRMVESCWMNYKPEGSAT